MTMLQHHSTYLQREFPGLVTVMYVYAEPQKIHTKVRD